jgi:AraC-like DNA-binding protein
MQTIPRIDAEHVSRILDLLDANGIPADRYLARTRIPLSLRENPVGFVHARSVWALVGAAEDGEALGDFWMDVAGITKWRRASWVAPMVHATVLGEALRVMCQSYVRQIPMNQLGLTLEGEVAWFWRRRLCDTHDWPGGEPAEQYTLSFILEVIRAAAGPRWLPERIRVESGRSGWAGATKRLPGVRIEFNQPMLAVAIPAPLLAVPISIEPQATTDSGCAGRRPALDFQGGLREVLESLVEDGLPTQAVAAEMLWTTPRTLRRRLTEEHTTWRAIVNDLRFARAVELLLEGRSSIREVAQALSYSDTAHFSRFFRERVGVAPTSYREEVERMRALTSDNPGSGSEKADPRHDEQRRTGGESE